MMNFEEKNHLSSFISITESARDRCFFPQRFQSTRLSFRSESRSTWDTGRCASLPQTLISLLESDVVNHHGAALQHAFCAKDAHCDGSQLLKHVLLEIHARRPIGLGEGVELDLVVIESGRQ